MTYILDPALHDDPAAYLDAVADAIGRAEAGSREAVLRRDGQPVAALIPAAWLEHIPDEVRGIAPRVPMCGLPDGTQRPRGDGRSTDLAERVTTLLEEAGYCRIRAGAEVAGTGFIVAAGAGVTVSVSWRDAPPAPRAAILGEFALVLHEAGLTAEHRGTSLHIPDRSARS